MAEKKTNGSTFEDEVVEETKVEEVKEEKKGSKAEIEAKIKKLETILHLNCF